MKKLLLILLFPTMAFAAQNNIVTWDDCVLTNTAAECAAVVSVDIEFKPEACTANALPWQAAGSVPGTEITFTHANQPSGVYCYQAFFANATGRGPASNTATKSVPLDFAPANLR